MLLWALAWIWLWPKKPNALIIPKAATSQCVSVDMCLNQAFLELGYGAEKEEYPWSLFKAWLRTKTHFFVFVAPNYAMIIPFNQISLQSQTALLAFLNQRVGKPRSALLGYRR
ncbi:MAG: YcxB family protein [Acidobacteria bacterium]|nr:YcxB family protein [Acidobacteriota bacterium]